jgi:hypothetical protein
MDDGYVAEAVARARRESGRAGPAPDARDWTTANLQSFRWSRVRGSQTVAYSDPMGTRCCLRGCRSLTAQGGLRARHSLGAGPILGDMAKLRYSDRKRMAEDGSLGPLDYGDVPAGLREAIVSIYENAARSNLAGGVFDREVTASCTQHFGKKFWGVSASAFGVRQFIAEKPGYNSPYRSSVDDVVDVVEILVEEGQKQWTFQDRGTFRADPFIEDRVNAAFVRHRFGYRLDGGEARRIGSPALDEVVVGPALIALRRAGWEAADKSFRDALHHRRGGPGERAAAITDAHASLEAAMKAAGLSGDRLSVLAKSFRNSGLVPSQLEGVPDLLDQLLKRSSSIRDPMSDAHGKEPDSAQVPAEIVDLAIHWAGAFIVYLSHAIER